MGPAGPSLPVAELTMGEQRGTRAPDERMASLRYCLMQADMSVTRKFGGTGLGLNIVKQVNGGGKHTAWLRGASGALLAAWKGAEPEHVAEQVVEAHDGTIACTSEVGRPAARALGRAARGTVHTQSQPTFKKASFSPRPTPGLFLPVFGLFLACFCRIESNEPG